MSLTVNQAFDKFNKELVNLDSEKTKKARKSRDWLIGQLNDLEFKDHTFPASYKEKHLKFGSFARNTKIRPLDDIDLIFTLKAQGSFYDELKDNTFIINVPESAVNLKKLCNEDDTLNSIKVVNKLVSSLKNIEHYSQANIHRRQEAVALKLTSYDWNFDIVPAFYTTADFYLIPDGNGQWKASNPLVDQSRIKEINKNNNGQVLQLVRTLKYWQNRPTMPKISSYLFEVMILDFVETNSLSGDLKEDIEIFWDYLRYEIYSVVNDPKGIVFDINDLDIDTKNKISDMAEKSFNLANDAIFYEFFSSLGNPINIWKNIFGDRFPSE
ncbi:hypothetical protein ABE179_01410 [Aliarcobacter skirrowii]|uniref:SMODS domain-containing nucleotidyltransferase n=1 Tax=Aliarcobacter skirrowii TaxID=28200 RepID=UPI0032099DEA